MIVFYECIILTSYITSNHVFAITCDTNISVTLHWRLGNKNKVVKTSYPPPLWKLTFICYLSLQDNGYTSLSFFATYHHHNNHHHYRCSSQYSTSPDFYQQWTFLHSPGQHPSLSPLHLISPSRTSSSMLPYLIQEKGVFNLTPNSKLPPPTHACVSAACHHVLDQSSAKEHLTCDLTYELNITLAILMWSM